MMDSITVFGQITAAALAGVFCVGIYLYWRLDRWLQRIEKEVKENRKSQ